MFRLMYQNPDRFLSIFSFTFVTSQNTFFFSRPNVPGKLKNSSRRSGEMFNGSLKEGKNRER